jgi:hypothetical protein
VQTAENGLPRFVLLGTSAKKMLQAILSGTYQTDMSRTTSLELNLIFFPFPEWFFAADFLLIGDDNFSRLTSFPFFLLLCLSLLVLGSSMNCTPRSHSFRNLAMKLSKTTNL